MLTREGLFWNKVNQNGPIILDTPCWNWTAFMYNTGYGQFWNGTRIVLAHRYSWELRHGNLPKNLFVCHKCDNPSCVNPEHLFLGTHQDNMHDMISKNRDYHNKKLTDFQVLQIYNSMKQPKDLSEEYDVHIGTIHEIKRGVTYKKVTQHQFKKIGRGRQKLTDEQVLLIFNSCKTAKQLGEEFNITPEMVRSIKRGKSHNKITGYMS
jgi:hypothetical protein